MKNQEVITDNSGITFFPSRPNCYRIMWWQIDQDGYEKWASHLSEKLWFTEKLCALFTNLCKERKASAFYN